MLFGYARISCSTQSLDLQIDALTKAGVHERNIFKEQMSAIKERPAFIECVSWLKEGDTLIVYRLDRVGRSLQDLVRFMDTLKLKKVEFRSLTEAIDTTTPTGILMFNIIASLTSFERDLTMERSRAGIEAKRARGIHLGRPSKILKCNEDFIRTQLQNGISISNIAKELKISRSPIYNLLKKGFKIHV